MGLFKGGPKAVIKRLEASVNRGERIFGVLAAVDHMLMGRPCILMVTDQRLLWNVDGKPEVVLKASYEDFLGIGIDYEDPALAVEVKNKPMEIQGVRVAPSSDSSLCAFQFTDPDTTSTTRFLDAIGDMATGFCSYLGTEVFERAGAVSRGEPIETLPEATAKGFALLVPGASTLPGGKGVAFAFPDHLFVSVGTDRFRFKWSEVKCFSTETASAEVEQFRSGPVVKVLFHHPWRLYWLYVKPYSDQDRESWSAEFAKRNISRCGDEDY